MSARPGVKHIVPALLSLVALAILTDALSLDFRNGPGPARARVSMATTPSLPPILTSDWSRQLRRDDDSTVRATLEAVTVAGSSERTVLGTDAVVDLRAGTSLTLKGWAVDLIANAPAGGVLVQIDDEIPLVAHYGDSRPDVAAALANASLEASGYQRTISTRSLHRGIHGIRILVLNAGRTAYSIIPPKPTRVRLSIR